MFYNSNAKTLIQLTAIIGLLGIGIVLTTETTDAVESTTSRPLSCTWGQCDDPGSGLSMLCDILCTSGGFKAGACGYNRNETKDWCQCSGGDPNGSLDVLEAGCISVCESNCEVCGYKAGTCSTDDDMKRVLCTCGAKL